MPCLLFVYLSLSPGTIFWSEGSIFRINEEDFYFLTETYKASWTRGMTQILVEEYRNLVTDFRNPHKKQKDLWYELASNMCQRGCDVTWDMCDRKWRNLKHTFKTIYYNQHRSAKSKRRWEFYSDLEELFTPQGSDEGLRKSRTLSPPSLDDQESISAGTSPVGLTTSSSMLPRLSAVVAPQVSYAQVLDVSSLNNHIVSYPQIVLCDESGIPINKKPNAEPLSACGNKSLLNDSEGSTGPPPYWFMEFMKQYRIDEERRLTVLKEMHAEVIQVERRKCVALESLVKKLG